jgi:prolyl oligopeptidase
MTPFPDQLNYPPTPRDDIVDTLHGTPVADPYRWLEEGDSEQTQQWIAAQNALTSQYLDDVGQRDELRQRLTELWNYEKYSVPFKRGERYFFTRNDGLQNQAVLYWLDHLHGEPRLLLDPNTLRDDGTVALTGFSVSDDGQLLAYGLSSAGSDWMEWRVREVESGQDRDDVLRWVKFSDAAWTPDNAGFFYSRYDEPDQGATYKGANYYQKLFYHRVGTPQAQDELIHEAPDHKDWGFGGQVTDDGRYLVISVWQGTRRENGILWKDLADPHATVQTLLIDFDAAYEFIGNDGARMFFTTDLDAPLGRNRSLVRDAPEAT